MKCLGCGQGFEPPSTGETNICGSCADEFRAEEDAYIAQAQAEAEVEAYSRYMEEQDGT